MKCNWLLTILLGFLLTLNWTLSQEDVQLVPEDFVLEDFEDEPIAFTDTGIPILYDEDEGSIEATKVVTLVTGKKKQMKHGPHQQHVGHRPQQHYHIQYQKTHDNELIIDEEDDEFEGASSAVKKKVNKHIAHHRQLHGHHHGHIRNQQPYKSAAKKNLKKKANKHALHYHEVHDHHHNQQPPKDSVESYIIPGVGDVKDDDLEIDVQSETVFDESSLKPAPRATLPPEPSEPFQAEPVARPKPKPVPVVVMGPEAAPEPEPIVLSPPTTKRPSTISVLKASFDIAPFKPQIKAIQQAAPSKPHLHQPPLQKLQQATPSKPHPQQPPLRIPQALISKPSKTAQPREAGINLISRYKVVTQSSDAFNGPAKLAVDGEYNQNYDSKTCTHTNLQKHPWWKIDLGSPHFIDRVQIWNRADCCGDRLNSLKVEISYDNYQWKQIGELMQHASNGGIYTINLPSSGRYIRLILKKDQPEYLTLCEVEIYGTPMPKPQPTTTRPPPPPPTPPPPPPPTTRPQPKTTRRPPTLGRISRGRSVSQSSDAFNGPAEFAVDGGYNQNYFSKSCSHTNLQKHPWWKIDLGSTHFIDRVQIWNRADCCGDRLDSLKIEVSDDNNHWKEAGAMHQHPSNGGIYTINSPSTGRYVRLILKKGQPQYLTLCEVEVYGHPLEDKPEPPSTQTQPPTTAPPSTGDGRVPWWMSVINWFKKSG